MDNFSVLEKKVHQTIEQLKRMKEEKDVLVRENKRLASQCSLLEEENNSARKLITQNSVLQNKQKKIKERIERLWEHIAQVI